MLTLVTRCATWTRLAAGISLETCSCLFAIADELGHFVHDGKVPRKPPPVFPQELRMLSEQGERLKLVRKRRQLGSRVVAQRAGISRTSVHMVESGDPGAILGTYLRVMAALGLEGDFNALAADDKVGCKLQDLALEAPRRRRTASTVAQSSSGREDGSERAS